MKIRKIKESEVGKIQEIDKDFYEGYSTSLDVLSKWFENFPEGFLVAEDSGNIVGYIFVELFNKIKAVPFIHDTKTTHTEKGKYLYVSGFGVKDGFDKAGEILMEHIIEFAKSKKCRAIIWVTGEKMKHDIYEKRLTERFGFKKKEMIEKWESHPNRFVSDHNIWVKKL